MGRHDQTQVLAALSAEVSQLRRQVKAIASANNLAHASLDNASLPVKDAEGRVTQVIGKQPDGSYGDRVIRSGPQPQPSTPIIEAGAGTISVRWDGDVTQGRAPHAFGRVEVWAAPGEQSSPSNGLHLSSIYSREGGATTIRATPGAWRVWLRMVGADGITTSVYSAPAEAHLDALVDESDIRERLEEFAGGSLDDAAYENLMVRLGEFLRVRSHQIDAEQVYAVHLAAGAVDGHIITGAHIQTSANPTQGIKLLGDDSALVGFDDDGRISLWLDGEHNTISGTLTVRTSGAGRMEVRPHRADQIFPDVASSLTYTGLGFHEGGLTVAGLFVRDDNGRLTVSAGTGPHGRPRAWMAGAYAAQIFEAAQELTAEDGCRVGSETIPISRLNGWRTGSQWGDEGPSFVRFGSMILLRGALRTPSSGGMADPFAVLPAPVFHRRLATARMLNDGSVQEPTVIEVGTDGVARIAGGASITDDRLVLLDGLFYYAR